MDQRGNRCGALHRVGQPCVQEQLRRFPHGSDEQQEGQKVRRIPLGPEEVQLRFRQFRGGGEDVIQLDAVDQEEQAHDAKRKAEIADPVNDESLDRGGVGAWFAVVEADQEIRGDANTFPAEEHLHEVVGGDQHQHGEGEEREIGEETRAVAFAFVEVLVMRHVADGIEVDERRHSGDDDQHDRGQPVHADSPVGGKRTALDPAHDLDMLGRAGVEGEEHDPRQERSQQQKTGGQPLRASVTDDAPAEARDDGTHERGEEDDGFHLAYPFITLTSSTSMVPRLRKKQTRIASPMAASAAATVSTNMVKTCPTRSPR